MASSSCCVASPTRSRAPCHEEPEPELRLRLLDGEKGRWAVLFGRRPEGGGHPALRHGDGE